MIDRVAYLRRIGVDRPPEATLQGLCHLHRQHLLNVPFEDLDIHFNRRIQLDPDHLFEKIVTSSRGGFCYELNYLFYQLLNNLGYQANMISARVMGKNGQLGPDYNHMALVIELEEPFLVDVGFGDLFDYPLKINERSNQAQGQKTFKLTDGDNGRLQLWESNNEQDFELKYEFSLEPKSIQDFEVQCHWTQTSPDSHFVKDLICSKATADGRETIYNAQHITHHDGIKTEELISDKQDLLRRLKNTFGIEIK